MLERLRRRLDLLPKGTKLEAIEARRGVVICEYLAEYRRLCAEVGPYRYAADLGLPSALADWRVIAYAAAWNDMAAACEFVDEAIEAAVKGFEDWQAAEETAKG